MAGGSNIVYKKYMSPDATDVDDPVTYDGESAYFEFYESESFRIPGENINCWKIQGDSLHVLDNSDVVHIIPITGAIKHIALPRRKHCNLAAVEYAQFDVIMSET